MAREDPPNVTVANLLPLLIPHAVVNQDITRHISAQRWVGLTVPDDCDGRCDSSDGVEIDEEDEGLAADHDHSEDDDSSSSERSCARSFETYHAIEISKYWRQGPFGRARYAALASIVALNDSHAVLQSMADLDELRLSFADRPYDAALNEIADSIQHHAAKTAGVKKVPLCRQGDESSNDEGDPIKVVSLFPACLTSSTVVRDAIRWLRRCPHRRPIDLPRYHAVGLAIVNTVGDPHVPFGDIARLVAHSVTAVQLQETKIRGAFDIDDLELLPRLSSFHCSRRIAKAVRKAVSKRGRESLRARVTVTSTCLASVFPHLTRLGIGFADTQDVSLWRGVASRPSCLRTLHCNFCTQGSMEMSEPIMSAFAEVSPTLSTLELSTFRNGFVTPDMVSLLGAATSSFRALRVFELTHIDTRGFVFDAKDRRAIEALPSAFPLLEKLTLLSVPITMGFVDALAKLSALEEWHSDYYVALPSGEDASDRHALASPNGAAVSGGWFPSLRHASLPCGYTMRAVAHAPHLRILSLETVQEMEEADAELALASTFSGVMFASPFVRFIDVTWDGSSTPTFVALRGTNVWGLTVRLRDHNLNFDDDDDDLASPPSYSAEAESVADLPSLRSLTLLLMPFTTLHRVTSLIDATRSPGISEPRPKGGDTVDTQNTKKFVDGQTSLKHTEEKSARGTAPMKSAVEVVSLVYPVGDDDPLAFLCDGRGMPELPPIAAMGVSREMLDAAQVCNAAIARDGDTTRCFEDGWT